MGRTAALRPARRWRARSRPRWSSTGGERAVATQIAPGRFGLLGRSDAVLLDVARVVERLQGVLKGAGLDRAQVLTETLAIDLPGDVGLTARRRCARSASPSAYSPRAARRR
jgi:hypothetical protein